MEQVDNDTDQSHTVAADEDVTAQRARAEMSPRLKSFVTVYLLA